jgi:hypothetical protein
MNDSNSKTLLFAAQQLEDMLTTQHVQDLDFLADGHVHVHADTITLINDIEGLTGYKNYYQAFFRRYEYKHETLVLAADEATKAVFAFDADLDVKLKEGVYEGLDDKDKEPSRCLSIFYYKFSDEGKVKDIYFLRQPSRDEMARKFVNPPDYQMFKFDPKEFAGPKLEPDEARSKKMHDAATEYNRIWATGDVSKVGDIMIKDVNDVNLMFGGEKKGSAKFTEMIQGVFKTWKVDKNTSDVAVTQDSNKAFIFWSSHGKLTAEGGKETEEHMYGLNLLIFDEKELKIKEILGFRQPLSVERPKLLKAPEDMKVASATAAKTDK